MRRTKSFLFINQSFHLNCEWNVYEIKECKVWIKVLNNRQISEKLLTKKISKHLACGPFFHPQWVEESFQWGMEDTTNYCNAVRLSKPQRKRKVIMFCPMKFNDQFSSIYEIYDRFLPTLFYAAMTAFFHQMFIVPPAEFTYLPLLLLWDGLPWMRRSCSHFEY